jgi:predicted nucleic acid-binding protein
MRVIIDTCILVSFTIRPNSGFGTIFDRIAARGVALASKDTIAEPPR